MSTAIGSQSLTREACYIKIAEKRCAAGTGISQIVNCLFKGVFEAYQKKHFAISSENQKKIIDRVGKDIELCILFEYIAKMTTVYKQALASLSVDELNIIVQNPTADATHSSTHAKFHAKEAAAFLPVKQKVINDLMGIGKLSINEEGVQKEIYSITKEQDPPVSTS